MLLLPQRLYFILEKEEMVRTPWVKGLNEIVIEK